MATLLATLEQRGYQRRAILDLPLSYVFGVLCHPRDEQTGELIVQYRDKEHKPYDHRAAVRASLRKRKVPEHLLEDVLARVLAEQELRRKARPKPKGSKRGNGNG